MKTSTATVSETQALPAERSRTARWLIPGVLLVVVLIGFFDRISVSVLFTDKDFQDAMGTGFDPAKLGLLMSGFLVAYGVSGVLLGWVVDLYGPRRMLLVGVSIWGFCMALMGTAGGFASMLAYRVGLGLSEGPQFGIANALVRRWFARAEWARANAVWTIGSPLGSAIGFPLTIWLSSHLGWRASFYVLAALNLLVVLPLVAVFIRDMPPSDDPRAAAAKPRPTSSDYKAGLALFLKNLNFWMITVFGCGVLVYLWGVNSWLPSYLMQAHGMNPATTSFYAALPFLMTIAGQLSGAYVSDRLNRRAAIAGCGLILAGLCIFSVPYMPSPQSGALMISLGGFFWGGATPTKYALLADVVPASSLATAVGVTNGIGNLVGALAPYSMGLIIGATGSFDAGFLVIVGAALAGGLALVPLMRRY